MRLSRSMICLDCSDVFDVPRRGRCPRCGSGAVWPLGKWIPVAAGVPDVRRLPAETEKEAAA
jgi:hypothetical protein